MNSGNMVVEKGLQTQPRSPEGGGLPDLRERDLEILRLLGVEEGTVAFQGLRRRMNIHQEKLSRALQRLEDDGFVQHTPRGYAITPRGSTVAQRWLSPPAAPPTIILQSYLPGDVSPQALAQPLEGRWFGDLRWLGIRDGPEGSTLRWVTGDSGVEVTLRIRWGQITLETDARDPEGMTEAFVAAQQIFSHLTGPWGQDWSQPHLAVTT